MANMYRIPVTIPTTIRVGWFTYAQVVSASSLKPHTVASGARLAMNVGQSLFYQIIHVRPITVEYSRDAAAAGSPQTNRKAFSISIRVKCVVYVFAHFFPLVSAKTFINFLLVAKCRNQNNTRYICQNVVRWVDLECCRKQQPKRSDRKRNRPDSAICHWRRTKSNQTSTRTKSTTICGIFAFINISIELLEETFRPDAY